MAQENAKTGCFGFRKTDLLENRLLELLTGNPDVPKPFAFAASGGKKPLRPRWHPPSALQIEQQ
ncbi:MAG: hypothetical protein H7A53_05765 [Akkermansiaceae bacterium]|nr:hypothetical protein [Akkermansiaceae bacterium]